jgi:hypothetical protein
MLFLQSCSTLQASLSMIHCTVSFPSPIFTAVEAALVPTCASICTSAALKVHQLYDATYFSFPFKNSQLAKNYFS